MKDSVCVGLTMKSIDYFQHGLPIINNIPADTTEIVEKYGVGLNVKENISVDLIKNNENFNGLLMELRRNNCGELFIERFSMDSFKAKLRKSVNDIYNT
jgi:hypothetical protein